MLTAADHLAAIAADPEADAPRLAYAGWLEQRGDAERGEFVRLCVRSSGLPSWGPARALAHRRAAELERKHCKAWLAELPALAGGRWSMERGVYDAAGFDSFTAFDKSRAALPSSLRMLVFHNLRSPVRLFACPDLAKTRGLRLAGCNLSPEGAVLLARCPHLAQLERLELSAGSLNEESLRALAEAPWLEQLRTLSIRGEYHGRPSASPSALPLLFCSPRLAGLRRLELVRTGMGEAGAAMLFAEGPFRDLETLEIRNEGIGPAGLAPLAQGARFPRLWRLEMERNHVRPEGTRLLGRLPGLRWLLLSANLIGNAGAEILADDEAFGGLEVLQLSNNAIGDAGAEALALSPVLRSLEHLDLSSNLIGDDGLHDFGATTGLPRLTNFCAESNSGRRELAIEVAERLRTQGPPLARKAVPPTILASPAQPLVRVGDADEDGLLEAIVGSPEDGLPRLVYADWLEEQGESGRAELIRFGPAPATPEKQAEYNDLVKRVAPQIPEEFARSIHRLLFAQGLMAAVVQMRGLLTKAFQERGGPWLRQVRTFKLNIVGTTKHWEKVAAMPLLGYVRNLDVSNCQLGRDGLAGLLGSPHLRGLFALNLAGNRLSRADTLKPLVETGNVPRLVNLDLSSNWLNMEAVRALLGWPQAGKLTALSLAGNWIHSTGAALLADSQELGELTYLNLSHNYLHDAAVQALVQGAGLPRLAHLAMAGNAFTDAAAHALAGSALLSRLRQLEIQRTAFTLDGVLAIARSPRLGAETKIHLSRYPYTASAQQQISEALGKRLVWGW